jgi:ribosome maturation factor RimP
MRVLLDNNVNHRFGALISAAETNGFEVMITADKQMQYQQNLRERAIAIIVLNSLMIVLEDISKLAPQVQQVLDSGPNAGSFIIVSPTF